MDCIQTRIPTFLWDSLQHVFYAHDYEFLRQVSYLIKVPVPELKRTLLGSKGTPTNVFVSRDTLWWEGQKCPLRIRTAHGLWKQCPNVCESQGVCGDHKGWNPSSTLKRKDDPYFRTLQKRKPFEWEGEIVWVSEAGDAVDHEGVPIPDIQILLQPGIVFQKKDFEALRK